MARHTWHHQEWPSTGLSLKPSRKNFQKSQSSFLQNYRTNPRCKKSCMWPEIVACEPRGGWKHDKLLPPAAGSFSATEAPANKIVSSQQKLQTISFFRGKREKTKCYIYPKSRKALIRLRAPVPVLWLLAFSTLAFLPCNCHSVSNLNSQ